jgi:hypothetical protein
MVVMIETGNIWAYGCYLWCQLVPVAICAATNTSNCSNWYFLLSTVPYKHCFIFTCKDVRPILGVIFRWMADDF